MVIIVQRRSYEPLGCEYTRGSVRIRAAIVLLSPHSHELVNRHEAGPVASSRAEQRHFPVKGTLTGLRRKKKRRDGTVCGVDAENRDGEKNMVLNLLDTYYLNSRKEQMTQCCWVGKQCCATLRLPGGNLAVVSLVTQVPLRPFMTFFRDTDIFPEV